MFRTVGWLVVTGFALYGAAQFIKAHVVADKNERSYKNALPSEAA